MSVNFTLADHANPNIDGTYDVVYQLPNIHMKSLSVHTPSCFNFHIFYRSNLIISGKSNGLNILPHNDVPFNLVCKDYFKLMLLNISQDQLDQQLTLNIESFADELPQSPDHWIEVPWNNNTLICTAGMCGLKDLPECPDNHSITFDYVNNHIVKLSKDECTRYNYYSEDAALQVLMKCSTNSKDPVAILCPLSTLLMHLDVTEYSITLPCMDSITNISISTPSNVKVTKAVVIKTPDHNYAKNEQSLTDELKLHFNNSTRCYEVKGLSDTVYMNTLWQKCTLRVSLVMLADDLVNIIKSGKFPSVQLNFDRVTLNNLQRSYIRFNTDISTYDVTLIKDSSVLQTGQVLV